MFRHMFLEDHLPSLCSSHSHLHTDFIELRWAAASPEMSYVPRNLTSGLGNCSFVEDFSHDRNFVPSELLCHFEIEIESLSRIQKCAEQDVLTSLLKSFSWREREEIICFAKWY